MVQSYRYRREATSGTRLSLIEHFGGAYVYGHALELLKYEAPAESPQKEMTEACNRRQARIKMELAAEQGSPMACAEIAALIIEDVTLGKTKGAVSKELLSALDYCTKAMDTIQRPKHKIWYSTLQDEQIAFKEKIKNIVIGIFDIATAAPKNNFLYADVIRAVIKFNQKYLLSVNKGKLEKIKDNEPPPDKENLLRIFACAVQCYRGQMEIGSLGRKKEEEKKPQRAAVAINDLLKLIQ